MFPDACHIISNCSGQYLSRKLIGTPMMPLHLLVLDENPSVHPFAVDIAPSSFNAEAIFISEDFELLWVVFIKETDGHAHDAATPSCV